MVMEEQVFDKHMFAGPGREGGTQNRLIFRPCLQFPPPHTQPIFFAVVSGDISMPGRGTLFKFF